LTFITDFYLERCNALKPVRLRCMLCTELPLLILTDNQSINQSKLFNVTVMA